MRGGDGSEDRGYASDGADGVHRQGRLIQPGIAAGRDPARLERFRLAAPCGVGTQCAGHGLPITTNRYEETKRSRQNGPSRAPANRNVFVESE